jgi:vesicle-fusing ATPase
VLDDHLVKLDGPQKQIDYVDPRNCLVFWARPPQKVRNLIDIIQQKLRDAAPGKHASRTPIAKLIRSGIWLMPLSNLHMTAMEVTHSKTALEIEHLVNILRSNCQAIADRPNTHRARLIKPMISYDSAALALSFVPASGEALTHGRTAEDDKYSYHHFRRDLHSLITKGGVEVGSRYVVPSAHLTIARFNTPNVFGGDPLDNTTPSVQKRKHWLHEIDMINNWLEAEYWPSEEGTIMPGGEWTVGEEKGLDFRKGRLWYGEGETVYLGKGFAPC